MPGLTGREKVTWRQLAAAAFMAAALGAGCNRSPGGAGPGRHGTPHRQHLRTAIISDPKTFNPVLVTDTASGEALAYVFEGLVRLNPQTLAVEPLLAERWESNADSTVYTFHLRRGVRWHDGVPFSAADVAFTFDAIYDRHVPNSAKHILTIDGQRLRTEVVDEHTVRFVLPRPFAPLLNSIGVEILPRHVLGAALARSTFAEQWGIDTPPAQIIGTGPYRMTKYVPAQYIRYRRNPDYWMKDEGRSLPYLEERTLLVVPNQDTSYLKFLAGETDVLVPRPEEVPELRQRAAEIGVSVPRLGIEAGIRFVAFNRNPRHYERDGRRDPKLRWFTDRYFLRALAHAIDKESMVRNCLAGFGQPAVAEISPANRLFHNPNLADYRYDLEEARRLLAAGGYEDRDGDGIREDRDGNPIEFSLHTNAGNQVREKMCSILKEDWTKLGLQVNYRPLEFTTLVEKLDTTFDWDAVLLGFTGGVEPHNGANILRSSGNLHVWNPRQQEPATAWEREIDALVEAGSRELDREKRQQIYWRVQEILHAELPIMPTVRSIQFEAYRDYVRNFHPTVWGLYQPERIRIAE